MRGYRAVSMITILLLRSDKLVYLYQLLDSFLQRAQEKKITTTNCFPQNSVNVLDNVLAFTIFSLSYLLSDLC